ncbi:type VI secretion system baseplate subunit TssE [Roseateles sp.]|uniref:type VI secretion system baseplate subunit TssE n=1 Tax=Roseateles sp. TaxID=1971397 RepID=UPI002E0B34FC|nr:type VI secretion system baseplate subunit TssE [Roseateles sp.]HEV6968739.1 type VI secretion system baseplate subunit TssE [Roseateles sp.]
MTASTSTPPLHPAARALPSDDAAPLRRKEAPFLPTLFDRLCDDAPLETSEAPERYAVNRSRLREIVLRDLQTLLNTTDISEQLDAQRFAAAASSTINYGVPPLAGGYLSEKKWGDIERMIRRAIERFEPRLVPGTLAVRPLGKESASAHYNVLTFEISGHIHMTPYPIAFVVQSAVDLETSRIDLQTR